MALVLQLLGDVRWRGQPVAGDRARALLAALAYDGGRAVQAARLIELVWGQEEPANSAKALQVLVSRTRSAYGDDAVVRDGLGYRLGVSPDQVDSIRLSELVRDARTELDRDAAAAVVSARAAIAIGDAVPELVDADAGSLREIRSVAAREVAEANTILARALSRIGSHTDALPVLIEAWSEEDSDEALLADLLQAEAAVSSPAAALERYEGYRQDLRSRLGANPGELLRAVHGELLALDQPVRSGVRYDPTALLGRDEDLERLRGMMRTSRVVSIVGAGGLGKTRLAHVLARDPGRAVSHVVELVGVASPEDVVAEVGAVLGVRDSVSSRRALTPTQRTDVRARIAQQLAQTPSLLVLDNCEHLIEAVAELVAFLVLTTPGLRVLTTSRAPLSIAAEQVYLLGELDTVSAVDLFRARAAAARPQVQLDDGTVASIVTRLDGLPLAIELAAAKVRVMSVQEIDRRLENRFALLRGGDRGAPDRHQTLLAVIDWSWNLLNARERRGLRWLALFNDGFTLDAAEEVLGTEALDAVQGLVDQSLLSVHETRHGIRYRMLETMREFGLMQLIDAGEKDEAGAARRRWAICVAQREGERLDSEHQIAAIDALIPEETNLADELRLAISDEDHQAMVALLVTLGAFWSIRGEHVRLISLAGAVGNALTDWTPPPELENTTRVGLALLLSNSLVAGSDVLEPIHAMLERLGPCTGPSNWVSGLVNAMLVFEPNDLNSFKQGLEGLAAGSDDHTARVANQWLSHIRENEGDIEGAVAAAEAALSLANEDDGPWHAANLRYQLGQLMLHLGKRDEARSYAMAALNVMQRIGARDDELQTRAVLALSDIADGRFEDAERQIDQMDLLDVDSTIFAGLAFRLLSRAELELARGQRQQGLRTYCECAAYMRDLRFPGVTHRGDEPWALFGLAGAVVAHAFYAQGPDEETGRALYDEARESGIRFLANADGNFDCPLLGLLFAGLGVWGLLREDAPTETLLRLLALARRFSYVRLSPTMQWDRIDAIAESRTPGQVEAFEREYRASLPAELIDGARILIEELSGRPEANRIAAGRP